MARKAKIQLTIVLGDNTVGLRNHYGAMVFTTPLTPRWAQEISKAVVASGYSGSLPIEISEYARLSLFNGCMEASRLKEIDAHRKAIENLRRLDEQTVNGVDYPIKTNPRLV